MQDYNTREIRAAARRLDDISDDLSGIRNRSVNRVSNGAKPLRGDTANALEDQLQALRDEIKSLERGLEGCSAALYEFARRLDIADAKAKSLIGTN